MNEFTLWIVRANGWLHSVHHSELLAGFDAEDIEARHPAHYRLAVRQERYVDLTEVDRGTVRAMLGKMQTKLFKLA